MTKRAFDGIRVVDLSHMIAGPFASFYLAQLGAEVFKIEAPNGGDPMRSSLPRSDSGTPSGYVGFNANKRSLAIDIRSSEGAEIVRELGKSADVFIENFRPGVVEKHGLDYKSIQALNPDIIYCSISGYGQSGQWARRPAYDYVIQAVSGIMMRNGTSDGPPMKVGFPIIDVAVGLLGALAISTALSRKWRHGEGQYIDVSMLNGALTLMYPDVLTCLNEGVEPPRKGNRGHSASPASDTFQCADGWITVTVNTAKQFRQLSAILDIEDLCRDDRAFDPKIFSDPNGRIIVARDEEYVRTKLHAAFVGRDVHDLEIQLNNAGVPAACVRSLSDVLAAGIAGDFPLAQTSYEQPDGTVVQTAGLGFIDMFDGTPPPRGAEKLGESTSQVLQQLGIDASRISALADQGVVKLAA